MAEGQEDIIILNGRWKMEELDLSTNTKMGSPDGKSDNNLIKGYGFTTMVSR